MSSATTLSMQRAQDSGEKAEIAAWLERLRQAAAQSMENAAAWAKQCYMLADTIQELVESTDFSKLYDEKRQLFSIGYSLDEERLTRSYYDLLASEARQASLLPLPREMCPRNTGFSWEGLWLGPEKAAP